MPQAYPASSNRMSAFPSETETTVALVFVPSTSTMTSRYAVKPSEASIVSFIFPSVAITQRYPKLSAASPAAARISLTIPALGAVTFRFVLSCVVPASWFCTAASCTYSVSNSDLIVSLVSRSTGSPAATVSPGALSTASTLASPAAVTVVCSRADSVPLPLMVVLISPSETATARNSSTLTSDSPLDRPVYSRITAITTAIAATPDTIQLRIRFCLRFFSLAAMKALSFCSIKAKPPS